eukprot:m.335890 g.335890  ORF g.335890 m.335890 type:complete len:413 (-) comp17701_c0_seq1:2363-3601(-)
MRRSDKQNLLYGAIIFFGCCALVVFRQQSGSAPARDSNVAFTGDKVQKGGRSLQAANVATNDPERLKKYKHLFKEMSPKQEYFDEWQKGKQKNLEVDENVVKGDPVPAVEKILYDAMLPVEKGDLEALMKAGLPSMTKNLIGLGNMYLVCAANACGPLEVLRNNGKLPDNVIIYPETNYEFKIHDMKLNGKKSGWNFQQALKLYTTRTIKEIRDNVLVIDSDTVWMWPTTFFDDEGRALLNYGTKTSGSFDSDCDQGGKGHISVLGVKEFMGDQDVTAITHHMMFNREIVETMLQQAEQSAGMPAWRLFKLIKPWMSEYEWYAAWATAKYPDRVTTRILPYMNTWNCDDGHLAGLALFSDLRYVACHDDYPKGKAEYASRVISKCGGPKCCVNTKWHLCPCCSNGNKCDRIK